MSTGRIKSRRRSEDVICAGRWWWYLCVMTVSLRVLNTTSREGDGVKGYSRNVGTVEGDSDRSSLWVGYTQLHFDK